MIPSGHQFGSRYLPVPYRPIRFVAKGAIGEVWKATGQGGLEVALKIVDLYGREGVKEFEGLQRIKNIRHANLVPIIGYWLIEGGQLLEDLSSDLPGTPSGSQGAIASLAGVGGTQDTAGGPVTLVIAMGWGDKSLFTRLGECGKGGIPRDELLEYMEGAAKGIDYLNSGPPEQGVRGAPIIHGDIKPQNILIVGDSVQVCDFGLARAVEAARKTTTGMGTVAYAAPELLRGKPHRTSDQYCLAISYFELRTGKLPFEEDLTPAAVVQRHETGELDFSGLTPGELEVVRRATFWDPDQRWPSCREMARALRRVYEAEEGGVSGLPSQPEIRETPKPGGAPPERPARVAGTLIVQESQRVELGRTPSIRQVAETVSVRPEPPGPTPAPRPRRRRLPAVVTLLVLVAMGGVGILAYPPARQRVVALFRPGPPEPERRGGEEKQQPKPVDVTKDGPPEEKDGKKAPTASADSVKEIEASIAEKKFAEASDALDKTPLTVTQRDDLLRKLNDAWSATLADLKGQKKYGEAIGVFEEAAARCTGSDDERKKQRGELITLWSSQIAELGKANQFAQALEELSAVPDRSEAGKEKGKLREELRVAWLGQFRALIKAKDFGGARKMLLSPPVELVDASASKSLEKELAKADGDARASAAIAAIQSHVLEKRFEDAIKALADSEKDLPESDRENQRDQVGVAWLGQLETESKSRLDSPTFLDSCKAMLGRFPESAEARLLQARALVQKPDYDQALDDLKKLASVPDGFRPLYSVLRFIADYHTQPAMRGKLKNEVEQRLASVKADQRFGMNRWEGPELEAIKKKYDDSDTGDKVKMAQQEFDTLLAQIDEGVKAGTAEGLSAAKGALQRAAALPVGPDRQVRLELRQATVGLCSPQAAPAEVDAAYSGALKLLEREDLLKVNEKDRAKDLQLLWLPLGRVGAKKLDDARLAKEIEQALKVVRAGCNHFSDTSLAAPIGPLWDKAVATAVKVREPTPQEFKEFEADWGLWEKVSQKPALDNQGLLDTWRLECQVLFGPGPQLSRQPVSSFAGLPAEVAPYARYVWACALGVSAKPDWEKVFEHLGQTFPAAGRPQGIIGVQGRLKRAVELAVKASTEIRPKQAPKELAGNPFGDQDKAAQHYRLLKVAYDSGVELAPDRKRGLEISLALAAWHKSQPEGPLVSTLTADLATVPDGQLGPDAVPLLLAYLQSHLPGQPVAEPGPKDGPAILRACKRLCDRVKDSSLGSEEIKTLYDRILKPAWQLAHAMRQDKALASGLEEFFASAGDLTWKHKDAAWPDDVYKFGEDLYASAIYHGGDPGQDAARGRIVSEYYTRRGQFAVKQKDPNLEGILQDADAALKFNPDACHAHALRGRVLLDRGKSRADRRLMIADLTASVKSYRVAVKSCPEAEKAEYLPEYLLRLGSACVLCANYESDRREEYLKLAAEYAKDASAWEHSLPSFPFLLLGNAYEDLAWLVEYDPVVNYTKAIDAFGRAALIEGPDKAKARCSVGRCYFKALWDTYLAPAEFKKQNDKEMVDTAIRNYDAAKDADSSLVELYFQLGRAYAFLAKAFDRPEDYQKADDSFQKAKDLAMTQNLANRATYVTYWASFPLQNRPLDLDTRYKKARERAEKLRGLPITPGGLSDPAKEEKLIEATAYRLKGQFDKEREVYDAALQGAKQVDASDIGLLLARANHSVVSAKLLQNQGNDQAADEAAQVAIVDAEAAAKAAVFPQSEASAHILAALGYLTKYEGAGSEQNVDAAKRSEQDWNSAKKHVDEAIALPSGRAKVESYLIGVRVLNKKRATPQERAGLDVRAVNWYDEATRLCRGHIEEKKYLEDAVKMGKMVGSSDTRTLLDAKNWQDIGNKVKGWQKRRIELESDAPARQKLVEELKELEQMWAPPTK